MGRSAERSRVAFAAVLHAHVSSHLSPLQADELSNPFGQISLSRQGSTEAPDPSSAMFQSSLISQHPQQAGFIMATPGQPIPTSNYSASGHTVPTQQVLQPQGYIQPPQQVRSCAGLEGMRTSTQICRAGGCWGGMVFWGGHFAGGDALLGGTLCWGGHFAGAALLFVLLICDGAMGSSQSTGCTRAPMRHSMVSAPTSHGSSLESPLAIPGSQWKGHSDHTGG